MDDFYIKFDQFINDNNLTFEQLGSLIGKKKDAFRMAKNRKKFKDEEKEILTRLMEGDIPIKDSEFDLFYYKEGTKVYSNEMIAFIIINIKKLDKLGKLDSLRTAMELIDVKKDYDHLWDEINTLKELVKQNKEVLQNKKA